MLSDSSLDECACNHTRQAMHPHTLMTQRGMFWHKAAATSKCAGAGAAASRRHAAEAPSGAGSHTTAPGCRSFLWKRATPRATAPTAQVTRGTRKQPPRKPLVLAPAERAAGRPWPVYQAGARKKCVNGFIPCIVSVPVV